MCGLMLVLDWHLHFRVSHLKELLRGHVCLHMISIISSVFLENQEKNFQEYDALSPPSWCYPPPLPCRWTPGSCQSGWWSCGHTGRTWQQHEFSSGPLWNTQSINNSIKNDCKIKNALTQSFLGGGQGLTPRWVRGCPWCHSAQSFNKSFILYYILNCSASNPSVCWNHAPSIAAGPPREHPAQLIHHGGVVASRCKVADLHHLKNVQSASTKSSWDLF